MGYRSGTLKGSVFIPTNSERRPFRKKHSVLQKDPVGIVRR